MLERLDKIVSVACGMSRKDARNVIKNGTVTVNGIIVTDIAQKTDTQSKILVGGQQKDYNEFVYIMLNKPAGILSASNDKTRKTVVDLVQPTYKRKELFPVGRLDKDTTGLLIITDDGDFAHKVISPKNYIEKEYIVTVDKPITDDDIKTLGNGVTLADGTVCRPAKMSILSDDCKTVSIVITEGKYHEIKRMLGVVDAGVISLHRKRIGALVLDCKLAQGEHRLLSSKEIEDIWK